MTGWQRGGQDMASIVSTTTINVRNKEVVNNCKTSPVFQIVKVIHRTVSALFSPHGITKFHKAES